MIGTNFLLLDFILLSHTSRIRELPRRRSLELESSIRIGPLVAAVHVSIVSTSSVISSIAGSDVHHRRCASVHRRCPVCSTDWESRADRHISPRVARCLVSSVRLETDEARYRGAIGSRIGLECLPLSTIREAVSWCTWTSSPGTCLGLLAHPLERCIRSVGRGKCWLRISSKEPSWSIRWTCIAVKCVAWCPDLPSNDDVCSTTSWVARWDWTICIIQTLVHIVADSTNETIVVLRSTIIVIVLWCLVIVVIVVAIVIGSSIEIIIVSRIRRRIIGISS